MPLLYLIVRIVADDLGPDPGKEVLLSLGFWAICFLWLTLAISPLRRMTGRSVLLRYRRMMGLYCWAYASLHFLVVLNVLLGWDWLVFVEEFKERPYMALGIIAWCLLLPLGLTSNRWAIRRLGSRWRRLHQLVYVIALCVIFHFFWLVRSDFGEVAIFAGLLLVLLAERIWQQLRRYKALAR